MSVKLITALHDNTAYNNYLAISVNKLNLPTCIVRDENNIVHSNIFQKYNKGINALKQNSLNINDNDIICFIHEDCKVEDPNFIPKLELIFEMKRDVGLIGVVGSKVLNEHCAWHIDKDGQFDIKDPNLCGHLIQEINGNNNHNVFGNQVGFFDNVCVVDGFFMAIRGKLINEGLRFDEATYSSFDFYDLDICLQVLKRGYKVGVADILLKHKSGGEGINKPAWQVSKFVFSEKWKKEGITFPLTVDQFKVEDHSSQPKINSEITLIEI